MCAAPSGRCSLRQPDSLRRLPPSASSTFHPQREDLVASFSRRGAGRQKGKVSGARHTPLRNGESTRTPQRCRGLAGRRPSHHSPAHHLGPHSGYQVRTAEASRLQETKDYTQERMLGAGGGADYGTCMQRRRRVWNPDHMVTNDKRRTISLYAEGDAFGVPFGWAHVLTEPLAVPRTRPHAQAASSTQ